MSYYRHSGSCPYCDTEYVVEYESADDELMHCPACGEQVPEFEDELDLNDDDDLDWD